LGRNFGFRHARKPIKGSKDWDGSLVSKTTLRPKIGSLDWSPGSGKVGQKTQKHPQLWRSTREPQTQIEKFFFDLN